MPRTTGNELWWGLVQGELDKTRGACYQGNAEIQLFTHIVKDMLELGRSLGEIERHFKDVFGINHMPFYNRLRHARRYTVINGKRGENLMRQSAPPSGDNMST